MTKKIQQFKTTDIILAACLKINGYTMSSIERNGNKGTFVFENIPDHFVEDFDLGKIQVEPVTFNNAIKQLTTSVRRMG